MRDWVTVPEEEVDTEFQRRIEALQSVDRSVAATVRTLRERGELDRTLLVFTSDNGYMWASTATSGSGCPTRSPSVCRCWPAVRGCSPVPAPTR